MRKLAIVAAALAAGLVTFAAYAKEAPARASAEANTKTTAKAQATPSRQKTAKSTKSSAKAAKKTNQAKASPSKQTRAKVAKGSTKNVKKSSKAAKSTVGFPLGNLGGLKKSVAATKPAPSATAGGDYHAIIHRYATSYGVPLSLAHAVVRVESNYRANARGKAGEIGLMQIKPATARMMGYSGSAKGLFNPETNIKYGMLYLAKAQQLGGGSLCQTILKYNAGHAAKRMNPISAAYCAKVKRLSTGL